MSELDHQKAELLFNQGNFKEAARVLREYLARFPDHGHAHASLAAVLASQKKLEEARTSILEALRLEPENAYSHYVSGGIYIELARYDDAERAAREAIRLQASDADYWCLLAFAVAGNSRWQEALEAAEQGLQLDATNVQCANARAMSLMKLGEGRAANDTVRAILAENPEDGRTHSSQGWILLHQDEPGKSLEFFSEALRLNLHSEWARAGAMEALRCHFLPYRKVLKWHIASTRRWPRLDEALFFWPWFAWLGVIVIYNLWPQCYSLSIVFAVVSCWSLQWRWLLVPVFNLALLRHETGRRFLRPNERIDSVSTGTLMALSLILLASGISFQKGTVAWLGVLAALLMFSIASAQECRVTKKLLLMRGYAACVACMGVASAWLYGRHELSWVATNLTVGLALLAPYVAGARIHYRRR